MTTEQVKNIGEREELNPFISLVKERAGLLFENEPSGSLANAVEKRAGENSCNSLNDYFSLLLIDEEELNLLIELLTVNETYFFRESVHFEILCDEIIPKLLREKTAGEKIKILSIGCSAGAEAYSIAITLVEKFGPAIIERISIIGTDIDRQILAIAREALYRSSFFRSDHSEILEKYFTKSGYEQQLDSSIKEFVTFKELNLLEQTYPEELADADIIFYRNVSIYFDRPTQKKILINLAELMKEKAFLFMSSTETHYHDIGILFLVEIGGAYLYTKDVRLKIDDKDKNETRLLKVTAPIKKEPEQKVDFAHIKAKAERIKKIESLKIVDAKVDRCGEPKEEFDSAVNLAKEKKYNEALETINKVINSGQISSKAYTLKASILLNLGEMETAMECSDKAIEVDDWSLEAFLLKGIIEKVASNSKEAIKHFKGAVYIKPSCWLAHFYLGELYSVIKNYSGAEKEFNLAISLLEKHSIEESGLTFYPLAYSAEQLTNLCNFNIKRIGELKA